MTDETPRTEAIWRVVQEPEDGSWTITDDTRPGFVVASGVLGDAVSELMTVMALWDQASDDLKELLPASNFREAAAPPEPRRPDVECASCGKAIGAAPRCRECYLRMVNKKQDAVDAARAAAPQGQPLDVAAEIRAVLDRLPPPENTLWWEPQNGPRIRIMGMFAPLLARLSESGSPGDDR